MGYYTRLSGSLAIVPPLPYAAVKDSPFTQLSEAGSWDAFIVVEPNSDGVLEGVRVEPRDEEAKAYDLTADLGRLVASFPGHKFTGHIQGEGEENTDLWRVYVRDSRVIRVEPQIVWPDPPA